MATNTWSGATADWYTSADWSRGVPTRTSAVVINSGAPLLQSGDAGITVASISMGGGALVIEDPSQTQSVLGNVSIASGGRVGISGAPNSGGGIVGASTLTIGGSLSIASGGAANVDTGIPIFGETGGGSITIGRHLSNAGILDIGNQADIGTTKVTVNGPGGIVNTGMIGIEAASLTSAGKVTTSRTLTVGFVSIEGSNGTDSSLVAPIVHVTGGLLDGTGVVTGAINNTGGTVEGGPDNQHGAIETLAVHGAYNQSGSGVLQANIGFPGEKGGLAVTGGIHLGGGTLMVDALLPLTLNTPYTVATFTSGDLTGKFAHLQTEGSLGSHTGNGASLNLGNGDTLKALYNNAAGTIQVEEVATPATAASTSGGASATTAGASTASQNTQAALLAQHAASSFAPASGGATVVTTPQVAATPLLASPHHA